MLSPFPAYVDPRDAKLRRRGLKVRIQMMMRRFVFADVMVLA